MAIGTVEKDFRHRESRTPPRRFEKWERFPAAGSEDSISLEAMDGTPGRRGNHIHFDHLSDVVREATVSAAKQAYMAVRRTTGARFCKDVETC